jgi:hypothetical protein
MRRKQIIRVAVVVLVLICLGAQVAEIFDSWDDTLSTGNETEYAVVMVALLIGSAMLGVRIATAIFEKLAGLTGFSPIVLVHTARPRFSNRLALVLLDTSPPALRI